MTGSFYFRFILIRLNIIQRTIPNSYCRKNLAQSIRF